MKKTFKKIAASMAAIVSLSVCTTSVSFMAEATDYKHAGSKMYFTSECSNNSPYSVSVNATNNSGSTRYIQVAIYSGSSLTNLTRRNSNSDPTSNKSAIGCSASNISDAYINTYANCYGDGTPYSSVVEHIYCTYRYGVIYDCT